MARRPKGKVLTDEELDQRNKNGDHDRSQKVRNAMNNIMIWAMYVAAVLIGLTCLGYIIHLIVDQKWDETGAILTHLATYMGGYLTAFLKKHGIAKE